MTKLFGRILAGCAASLLLTATASADIIGLNGTYLSWFDSAAVLTGGGHTVVSNINLNAPITVDVLYLDRDALLSGSQAANVRSYLEGGGCVITEFSATQYWFNGTLASFAGSLVNSFHFEGASIPVNVDLPADPLAAGLPGTWNSGNPIQFFNVFSGIDAAITLPISVNSSFYGKLPVVGHAAVGSGTAIMFFSDFGDFVTNDYHPAEAQLLLNAAMCGASHPAVPEPGTIAMGVGLVLGAGAALRRRRAA
jgi:uncharacterized protein (TIGR03382 family)